MCLENDSKLVSVIIPTYNRADMVTRVLDSVWGQSYRPIELLVVNDGSSDNTSEVIHHWMDGHPDNLFFVTRLLEQKNSGGCVARNLGLSQATGEYVQFFDDDDELLPEAIEASVRNLSNEANEVVSLGQAIYCAGSETLHTHFEDDIQFPFCVYNLPSPSFSLFRRNYLVDKKIFWDGNLSCGQDTDFVVTALLKGIRYKIMSIPTCRIYFHGQERVTQKLSTRQFEKYQYLLTKWHSLGTDLERDPEELRLILCIFVKIWLQKTLRANNRGVSENLCRLCKERGYDVLFFNKVACFFDYRVLRVISSIGNYFERGKFFLQRHFPGGGR